MQEERYITNLDTAENRAIVEEMLEQMKEKFISAANFAQQKVEALEDKGAAFRLMQDVRAFFFGKACPESAWPKISFAELGRQLGCEGQPAALEAACAMMRLSGQLVDTRGEHGEIEPDVVYPLIKPLYDPAAFKTVRQTLLGTGNPFLEYCWFNNMDAECWYRVRRNKGSRDEAMKEVAAFVTQRVNELVRGEMLRRFDIKGATVH